MMHKVEFNVKTPLRDGMLDITPMVADIIHRSGISEGQVTVYVPHTTAGVTINENADPDVIHDILETLDRVVPWRQDFYRHCEGNSAAHVKSSMVGCSAVVPVSKGMMTLGTWQSIFLCEFDGPRTRKVIVAVMS